MNDTIAPAASFSNAVLKSSALIPATSANCSNESPPCSTASCILDITVDIADPPASASIPTLDNAPAKPSICASLMSTCFPAPASRSPISTISDSVVARLFPSETTVDPRLPNFSCGI